MKYRIEIWQDYCEIDSYESDSAGECRDWIKRHGYADEYEKMNCALIIYENGNKLKTRAEDEFLSAMTNFEWLKSLSAEELAKWFYTEVCLMKCPAQIPPEWKESKCGDCTHIPECDDECTLKWLLEERKEEGNDKL